MNERSLATSIKQPVRVPKSKRIIFRELQYSDVGSLLEILGDPETMRFYPSTYNLNEVKDWVKRSRDSYEEFGFGLWAIYLKKNNQFIGQCGLTMQLIRDRTLPEIGFHIHKRYWNRGYGSEAAAAVEEYAKSLGRFRSIYIQTYYKNIPAQMLAIKIGFTKVLGYEKLVKKGNVLWKHFVYEKKVS